MGMLEDVGERLVRFRVKAGFEPDAAAARARIEPDRLDGAEAGTVTLSDDEIARARRSVWRSTRRRSSAGASRRLQDYAGGA